MTETRHLPIAPAELRVESRQGQQVIRGYAALYGVETKIQDRHGAFREVILPGAFRRALAGDKCDVRCLQDHNPSLLLGRMGNGTLVVREDQRGLYYECTPPNTQAGRDAVELVRRGDLSGSSFGFQVPKGGDTWTRAAQPGQDDLRQVRDVDLYDVGPVTFPAYEQTSVALRSQSLRPWLGAFPPELARKIVEINERLWA